MKAALLLAVALSLQFAAQSSRADESDCVAYLRQDIHNKFVVIDNATGKQVSSSSLCKNQAQGSSSGLSVQYAGVGLGFNQASSLAQAMCDQKFSQSDLTEGSSVYRSVVDPSIMQASLECFRLNAKGLHFTTRSDTDTHSVSISMNYDGPNSINVSDIVMVGNAQCKGALYSAWSASVTRKVELNTKSQGLTCMPKDPIDAKSPNDIASGSITVMTEAGPIYAEIPRRFSPSLESQFQQMQALVRSMQTTIDEHSATLTRRILATAIVKAGTIVSISEGASLDINSGKFTFPNPAGLKFIPVLSSISPNGQYLTESCYVRTFQTEQPTNSVILWQGAQDTSGRNHPMRDCTIAIVGLAG